MRNGTGVGLIKHVQLERDIYQCRAFFITWNLFPSLESTFHFKVSHYRYKFRLHRRESSVRYAQFAKRLII